MLVSLKTEGEAQQKAFKEVCEKLEVLEEGLKNFYPDCGRIDSIDNLGVLDLVILSLFGGYDIQEEVLGFNARDPEKTPLISSWLKALRELPLVKAALPPREKFVGFLKFLRQNALKSSAA